MTGSADFGIPDGFNQGAWGLEKIFHRSGRENSSLVSSPSMIGRDNNISENEFTKILQADPSSVLLLEKETGAALGNVRINSMNDLLLLSPRQIFQKLESKRHIVDLFEHMAIKLKFQVEENEKLFEPSSRFITDAANGTFDAFIESELENIENINSQYPDSNPQYYSENLLLYSGLRRAFAPLNKAAQDYIQTFEK
ncbi:MAG: hypothetical protein HRT47_13915 [Candidatus Caenarcaniphilales bacterium]|nr:hypothetical protein [Candidatus Caenarcaniphilales bacterium]